MAELKGRANVHCLPWPRPHCTSLNHRFSIFVRIKKLAVLYYLSVPSLPLWQSLDLSKYFYKAYAIINWAWHGLIVLILDIFQYTFQLLSVAPTVHRLRTKLEAHVQASNSPPPIFNWPCDRLWQTATPTETPLFPCFTKAKHIHSV